MTERLPEFVLRGISDISETLELRYWLSGASDATLLGALDDAARSMEEASAAGAFCDVGTSLTSSSLRLASPAVAKDRFVMQTLSCHKLDPRVLRCLGQMALRLRTQGLRLERIEAADPSSNGAPAVRLTWPKEEGEEQAYPQASDALLSLLRFEGADHAKSRRFLIEADRSLSAVEIQGYEAWIEPWKSMLEHSAFALPVASPDEIDSLFGSVSQFDDTTVEVHIDVFAASEQAWITLGHMTLAYWGERARITRLLVD